MRVKVLANFHDNLKDVDRKCGEEFVVTKDRFAEINAVGMECIGAPIVEEVVEKAVAVKETPESRASKAPAKRRAAKKKEGE